MLQSNYNIKSEDPIAKLKKRLLAKPEIDNEALTTEEIDADINGNRPALSKEEVDRFKANEEKSDSEITGGNYNVKKPISTADYSKDIIADGEEASVGKKIGAGAIAGAGGVLDMVSTVAAQKGPMTKKENTANTMNLGMKGMSTGASIGTAIGGPYGAAIGAGAGLLVGVGTGLIKSIGDKDELANKAKLERATKMNGIKDSREEAQKLSEGKKVIQKQKNILQAQMGMLGSNYSTSKN
jgi:hypothetical protein